MQSEAIQILGTSLQRRFIAFPATVKTNPSSVVRTTHSEDFSFVTLFANLFGNVKDPINSTNRIPEIIAAGTPTYRIS